MTLSSTSSATKRWQRPYRLRLIVTDTFSVIVAVFGSQFIRFGVVEENVELRRTYGYGEGLVLSYSLMSVIFCVLWLYVLSFYGTRNRTIVGVGSAEYKLVVNATMRIFGLLAIACYLLQVDLGRGYFLLALPFGLILLVLTRWLWRVWLNNQRKHGAYFSRVLMIGERVKTGHVAKSISRESKAGLQPVGALVQDGDRSRALPGNIPVLGGYDRILETVDANDINYIVFTGSDEITPDQLRTLGWELEQRGVELIVAPALTDIAGPRIHAAPIAGLPLIHVAIPTFEGRKYISKRALDIFGSGLGLLILSPVFLLLAILIKLDSRGPVFFRQARVGLNGKPFKMVKFRSMIASAEDVLPSLLDSSEGNDVLFKMKNDPRVTKLGKFMRRFSIDELPQLLNVFIGEMSLVGPRPPLQSEVDKYEDRAHRRFLVKPGMTGLWQVSGRSDLSWEDSLRLDLYYVENWTMTGDLVILWKTARAVFGSSGAY